MNISFGALVELKAKEGERPSRLAVRGGRLGNPSDSRVHRRLKDERGFSRVRCFAPRQHTQIDAITRSLIMSNAPLLCARTMRRKRRNSTNSTRSSDSPGLQRDVPSRPDVSHAERRTASRCSSSLRSSAATNDGSACQAMEILSRRGPLHW